MSSAISSRNTSTRNRWEHTTPKRTSPSTSAKIPSSRSSLTKRERHAKSPLKATLPFGTCYKKTPDRYIYDAVKKGFYNAEKKGVKKRSPTRKLMPESRMSLNATIAGTHLHLKNTPYQQKFGGKSSHAGSVMKPSALNSLTEKSATSTT